MAKSFDELIGKTGNKKTRKIAAKRTEELLGEYYLAENSELINGLKNAFLGPQPTKDGSISYWGTDQLDEEVDNLIQRMTLKQKLWLLSACGVISMENE